MTHKKLSREEIEKNISRQQAELAADSGRLARSMQVLVACLAHNVATNNYNLADDCAAELMGACQAFHERIL